MKTKALSPEKLKKIQAKREKEIAKWEKEKARPKRSYYFAYLVLIICIIYATDEIASQISTLMKTEIANDLFSKFGESSVGLLDILSILVVPFQALGLLYRPLADKWGRKKFLIINTFGMSFAMFVVFLSGNLVMYFIGACMIQSLGTSWCFRENTSGRIVSNCLKRPAGEFQRERLSMKEVKDALKKMMEMCPDKEFIFTVSPIRHFKDGAHGNQVSKATLLLGIEEVISEFQDTRRADYFPSYEIMMDELRDYRFYAEDMCHPTSQAVDYIRERFLQWALPATENKKLEENIRKFKQSRHINKLKMFILLIAALFTASCGKALLDEDSSASGNHNLIITGIVSHDSMPLEGIRLTFSTDAKNRQAITQTVYSDSKGCYWISLQNLSNVLSCSVTADDLNNQYNSQTCMLTVDWSGPSFTDNTFYVNDLNISLTKVK